MESSSSSSSSSSIAAGHSAHVEQAVQAMYHSTDVQTRNAAMHWLESFQNSHDAWQMSIGYLRNIDDCKPEIAFYAAQTLKHKVVSDLSQLTREECMEMFRFVEALAYKDGLSRMLRTQIILSLAAFYVQLPVDLAQGEGMKDERVFVELAALIPEQLNNRLIHLTTERFEERKLNLMTKNANSIVPLFLKALHSEDFCQIAIEGLQNWIHYADLTCQQAIHILQVAVVLLTGQDDSDGLVDKELVSGACELICELCYQNSKSPEFFAAFAHYLPHLCNLLQKEDQEVKAVGSMLTECSEFYLAEIVNRPDLLQSLIPAVLFLTSNPDTAIAEVSFVFWAELQMIVESNSSSMDVFVPVFENVFKILLPKLQFKGGHVSAEERERFRDFRHVIGDCLKDCCRVIGSTGTVELISAAFHQASTMAANQWQPVEAVLFALRSVSSIIDRRESEQLPILYPIILGLKSPHPRLVYAILLVIGCLSDWLLYHADFILPSLEYIVGGLTCPEDTMDPEVELRAAAAMALRYLCESCPNQMLKYGDQLIVLYGQLLKSGKLDKEDQLSLTESICHVLVADGADINLLLPKAIEPVSKDLQMLINDREAIDTCLEHLALYVEMVIPDATSMLNINHPMVRYFVTIVQPLLPSICRCHHHLNGLSAILKAAVSRYSRCLGQEWLSQLVEMCQGLYMEGVFDQAVYTLRYIVLLGECNNMVRTLIINHFSTNLSVYAKQRLDLYNLATSMYDYWRGDGLSLSVKTNLCLLSVDTCSDQSAAVNEVSACIIMLIRMSTCEQVLMEEYWRAVRAIMHSCLVSANSQVQSDCAVLLHRLGKKSPDHVIGLFKTVLCDLTVLTTREQEHWVGVFNMSIMEPRPKPVKTMLISLSEVCKRRL